MYHFNKRMLKQIRLTNIIIRLCFCSRYSCIAAVAFVKQNSNLKMIYTKIAFVEIAQQLIWIWISYVNFAFENDELFQKYLAILKNSEGEKLTHNFYLFFKKLHKLLSKFQNLFHSKILTSFSDRDST